MKQELKINNKLNSFPHFLQFDQNDCGVTCIKMILKYYNSDITNNRLRELTKTDKNGVSAYGIKKCFESLNFECKVLKANDTIWLSTSNVFPLIANIKKENGSFHYVVIYDLVDNKLLVSDPADEISEITVESFNDIWTNIVILMEPSSVYNPLIENVKGLSSFFPMVANFKLEILKIFFSSIFVIILNIISSYYIKYLIDNLIPKDNVTTINILTFGLGCSYFLKSLFEIFKGKLLIKLGQNMNAKIISDYLKHILEMPIDFFQTRKKGDIISRLLDGSRIIDALASGSIAIFIDLIMIIIISFVLAFQNLTLFIFTLILLPLYTALILFFSKKISNSNDNFMIASSNLNSVIIESIDGIETIKSYSKEKLFYNKVLNRVNSFMNTGEKMAQYGNLQDSLKNLIDAIMSALILWFGSFFVLNGSMTVGELIMFNSLLTFFTMPLQNIVSLQPKIQSAEIASKRLNEFFLIEKEQSTKLGVKKFSHNHTIEVSNLSFSFNYKNNILTDLSLQILKGEKVAIIGPSGSGKSTLGKLLINLYNIENGKIFFDGNDINEISLQELRDEVCYVSQNPFFFSGTILENLIFDNDIQYNIEELNDYCAMVELDKFIDNLPLKYSSHVEEMGENLSGGQKKRLAVFRALLKKPKIFVFDEITSGLDMEMESKLIDNLFSLENETMIFITHSPELAKKCNKVFEIKEGILQELV